MPDPMPPTASRQQVWISALRQASVWKRAATLGLSVGLFQAALNQGDYWVNDTVSASIVAKTIISPLITFSVALASAASMWVEKQSAN
jgi:H+/Cl- antiporter ClcA